VNYLKEQKKEEKKEQKKEEKKEEKKEKKKDDSIDYESVVMMRDSSQKDQPVAAPQPTPSVNNTMTINVD
jgi:hypothetical protein